MGNSETWRVVVEGLTREAIVSYGDGSGTRRYSAMRRGVTAYGATPRDALIGLFRTLGHLDIAEIVAPDEMTRAEAIEATRAECALCVEHLSGEMGAESIRRTGSPKCDATEALDTAARMLRRLPLTAEDLDAHRWPDTLTEGL